MTAKKKRQIVTRSASTTTHLSIMAETTPNPIEKILDIEGQIEEKMQVEGEVNKKAPVQANHNNTTIIKYVK